MVPLYFTAAKVQGEFRDGASTPRKARGILSGGSAGSARTQMQKQAAGQTGTPPPILLDGVITGGS